MEKLSNREQTHVKAEYIPLSSKFAKNVDPLVNPWSGHLPWSILVLSPLLTWVVKTLIYLIQNIRPKLKSYTTKPIIQSPKLFNHGSRKEKLNFDCTFFDWLFLYFFGHVSCDKTLVEGLSSRLVKTDLVSPTW